MIKIVTDSTGHLTQEQAQANDITVVPAKVIFGTTEYRDEVDLTKEQFYEMLPTAKHHPTTSQPSAGDFVQVYRPILDAGREIVSIHLASKLSGTYASACTAKTELEDKLKKTVPITILDTPFVSMAFGMLVLVAAQAAAAGKSRDEIVAAVNALIPKMNLILVLDTLEYLKRGGRIGAARALLGTALNVKPLLEVKHGAIEPLEQQRSRAKALKRLLEIMEERVAGRPVHVTVLHARAIAEADAMEKELRARFACQELFKNEIGPAVGVHTGPGALGLAFYAD